MKRSRMVELGAVVALSTLVMTACADDNVVADCVETVAQADGTHKIVDDRYCDDHHLLGPHVAYYRVYGATRSGLFARGGTTRRPTGGIVTRSGKTIQRGGFGGRGTGGS